MKNTILFAALALTAASSASAQTNFDYEAVEAGVTIIDFDGLGDNMTSGSLSGTVTSDRLGLQVPGLFLKGGIGYGSMENDVAVKGKTEVVDTSVTAFALGVGYATEVHQVEGLDAVITLGYLNSDWEFESNGTSLEDDIDGLTLDIAGKFPLTDAASLEAGVETLFDSGETESVFRLMGQYDLNHQFAVRAGVGFGDDVTGYTASLRMAY